VNPFPMVRAWRFFLSAAFGSLKQDLGSHDDLRWVSVSTRSAVSGGLLFQGGFAVRLYLFLLNNKFDASTPLHTPSLPPPSLVLLQVVLVASRVIATLTVFGLQVTLWAQAPHQANRTIAQLSTISPGMCVRKRYHNDYPDILLHTRRCPPTIKFHSRDSTECGFKVRDGSTPGLHNPESRKGENGRIYLSGEVYYIGTSIQVRP
jgi:hypothetical protein